jgi:hypothetical protein
MRPLPGRRIAVQTFCQRLFAGAIALLAAVSAAQAESGPCKPDKSDGLTCGEGIGASRVIEGTISPSKRFALAWRSKSSAPADLLTDRTHYDLEDLLIRLADGALLSISPGEYWNTGSAHVNRYEVNAAWSPDSRFMVETLDFRWDTPEVRLYAIGAGDKALVLDLKAVMEPAVRKHLRQAVKDEGAYDFSIFGSANSEHPHLTIDNRGQIKAMVLMVIPKQDSYVTFDVAFQVSVRNGALTAREISIRRSHVEP